MILYTLRDMITKNPQKNFGQHLLQICCSTTVIVKFDIIFFAKIAQRARMAIFCKKKLSLLYHILFLRTSISFVSTKKNLLVCGQKAQSETRQKKNLPKISANFSQFTWYPMCLLYFSKCCYIVTGCCLWSKQQMLIIWICCK